MDGHVKQRDSPFSNEETSGADLQNIYSAEEPVSRAPSLLLPPQELRRSCNKVVKYMECLKNHAAGIGGNAMDGCGEFMPGGKVGTVEALKCSACSCHRNFHRKEMKSVCISQLLEVQGSSHLTLSREKCSSIPSESDEKDVDDDREPTVHVEKGRKRFRTKFTREQKEKMLSFSEKVGWKIQKLDEKTIQEFCHETGIKRRVLKVWMHNNKHTYAKGSSIAD